MRKLLQEELYKIITSHKVWADTGGVEGKRADLSGAYLTGADLKGVDLTGANLREANLIRANLQWANLIRANLKGADLRGAQLQWADLQRADLKGVDLRGAYLRGANLQEANLTKVDLSKIKSFWKCRGDGKRIKNIYLNSDRYKICYTSTLLQIGCCLFKISKWEKFSDDEILALDKYNPQEGLAWWKENRDKIFQTIKEDPAEKRKGEIKL